MDKNMSWVDKYQPFLLAQQGAIIETMNISSWAAWIFISHVIEFIRNLLLHTQFEADNNPAADIYL